MPWGYVAGAVVGAVANNVLKDDPGGTAPGATDRPSMTPEQQAALQQLLARITGRSNATAPYTGSMSAGPNSGQRLSLAAMEQMAMNQAGGPGSEGQARDTLGKAMSDTGTDVGDYFENAIAKPETARFKNDILPSITARFKGNAAYGDDRLKAELGGAEDLMRTLTGKRSELTFNAKEAAKNRALQAAGMVPGMDQSRMDMLFKLFGAQSGAQSIEQQALDRQYAEFIRQQKGEETNISQILAALGLQPLNTVVTPGQPGFLTSAAPGIGNAATQYALNYLTKPRGTTTPSGGTVPIDAGGYDSAGGYYGG